MDLIDDVTFSIVNVSLFSNLDPVSYLFRFSCFGRNMASEGNDRNYSPFMIGGGEQSVR